MLWATYAPAMRFVMTSTGDDMECDVAALSVARASVAFAPFTMAFARALEETRASASATDANGPSATRTHAMECARAGGELGAYGACAMALQAFGLARTSSAHGGFIMGSVSALVPALARASGERVDRVTLVACATSIAGVALIAYDSAREATSELTKMDDGVIGDAATFAAAACYAALTVRASTFAREHDAANLVSVKSFVTLCFMASWYAIEAAKTGGIDAASFSFMASPAAAGAVVYSSLAPGALANYLQMKGQASVPAAEAQIIYATTPVFNAVLSVVLLHESLSPNALLGGAVILAASLAPVGFAEKGEHSLPRDSPDNDE